MDTAIGEMLFGLNATHMLQYEIPVGGVTTDVVGLFNHDNFARSLPKLRWYYQLSYNQVNTLLPLTEDGFLVMRLLDL